MIALHKMYFDCHISLLLVQLRCVMLVVKHVEFRC